MGRREKQNKALFSLGNLGGLPGLEIKPALVITPSTETNSSQMSNIFLNRNTINNIQGKRC